MESGFWDWALGSQPPPRALWGQWGGGRDESLAAASNGSSCLCQVPEAPPGWGCPLLPLPWLLRPGRGCEGEEAWSLWPCPAAENEVGEADRCETDVDSQDWFSRRGAGQPSLGEGGWEWQETPHMPAGLGRAWAGQFLHSGCCPGRFSRTQEGAENPQVYLPPASPSHQEEEEGVGPTFFQVPF